MNFSENFENAKQFAVGAAQAAAKKTKELAAAAKLNLSIYMEEDKIRKAQQELGRLYYRDYSISGEMDAAEYLPWCQKIDESKRIIDALREQIAGMREDAQTADEVTAEPTEPACLPSAEE